MLEAPILLAFLLSFCCSCVVKSLLGEGISTWSSEKVIGKGRAYPWTSYSKATLQQ
jgi:hypothetical protein